VITAGVLPPLLARRGLRAALEAYARQAPDRPTLVVDGLDGRRYPTAVEVAVYSSCVEALRMLPGAELVLDARDDHLALTVRGRPGEGAGWQHLADRVEALGGRLSVDPAADGSGSVLQVVVPGHA
jgi:signal transduction histidine kinase